MMAEKDQREFLMVSRRIYESLQVVLEFMDKGVKGLLSGDLSVVLLQQIQTSIEKYQKSFKKLAKKIEDLLDKQETVDEIVQSHFLIPDQQPGGIYEHNIPAYANILKNFQDFTLTLDQREWKKTIQLKQ